jgi:hypothetical protein
VLIGLLHKVYPNGCQHRSTNPVEAKALPHEGASALVSTCRTCTRWLLAKGYANSFTFETQTSKNQEERQQKGAPKDKRLLLGSS